MKFILKLIGGIIGGIIVGYFAPDAIIRFFITFEHLFNEFLGFIIPFIIFFFIASGITSLQRNSGQILGITVGAAYISTVLAGIFACFVAVEALSLIDTTEKFIEPASQTLKPYFNIDMPPFTEVTGALIAAFLFGIGASTMRSKLIIDLLSEGKNITQWVITTLILPLLPFYIASVFVNLTAQGTIVTTLQAFGLILLLAVTLHWAWLAFLYGMAGFVSGTNGFTALKNMLSAYMTGVGTMSSVATIPVALKQTRKNGVSEAITNFTIPLFANIHLSGSTITITTCVVAVMTLTHTEMVPSVGYLLPFIMMLGLVMVAAPGVPGGAVMSALGILTSMLGFTDLSLGLIIALYIAQDSFGTACNVTGDGALAIMIDKLVHKKALLVPEPESEEQKALVKDIPS